jgi:phosphatidylinositol alpha-mannosyltransferase
MLLSLNRLAITAVEKVTARIAVSEAARNTVVRHIGGDAVIIPNGVDTTAFQDVHPRSDWVGEGPTLVFLGRLSEPRKGLHVLIAALPAILAQHPGLRLLVAGPGEQERVTVPDGLQACIRFLGRVSDTEKAAALASADIYVAPNTGGESFGIVLLEAMAAGTPVVASDLEAFVRVLGYGAAGRTFHNKDSSSLAEVVNRLLAQPEERERLRAAGRLRAAEFDWSLVAADIVDIYDAVAQPGVHVVPDLLGQMLGRWRR